MRSKGWKRDLGPWAVLAIMLTIYFAASLIEPCDGHSCDRVIATAP
jgi:hypothetical protein